MAANKQAGISPEILKILLYAVGAYMLYQRFFGKKIEDIEAEKASAAIKNLEPKNNPLQTETYKPSAKPAGFIYFRTDKTNPAIPKTYFVEAARDINKSFGIFNDDEAAITRAIKKAITKAEVNLISRAYSALYKEDLFYKLNNKLNKAELEPIYNYILKLPDSIKGN